MMIYWMIRKISYTLDFLTVLWSTPISKDLHLMTIVRRLFVLVYVHYNLSLCLFVVLTKWKAQIINQTIQAQQWHSWTDLQDALWHERSPRHHFASAVASARLQRRDHGRLCLGPGQSGRPGRRYFEEEFPDNERFLSVDPSVVFLGVRFSASD
jgi:hypothetical protein